MPCQDLAQVVKVRDPIHTDGALLGAETAVQIAADRGMPVAAGKLSDVVNMIGHRLQPHDLT